MLLYFFTFVLALCTCLYLTPIVIEAAITYDIVDRPDGNLKRHQTPVAYLGGISVYLSFLATLALTFDFSREVLGLLLAGTIVILLGIIDDLKPLGPKLKLMGQAISVFVLIKCGIYIQIAVLPHWLCLGMTVFWMLAIINAFNIIDIMDGLSAGTGLVAAGVLFAVAVLNERFMIAVMTISLAGALLGFLRYNYAPAKIYLGDSGSMFIGMMLGALAMIGSYTEHNNFGYLAPPVILGIPLFDTMFVMYLRWRKGMPVIHGSPDHFALRLRKWKLSTRQTVLSTYGVGLLLGAVGIAMMQVATGLRCASIFLFVTACGLAGALLLKRIKME